MCKKNYATKLCAVMTAMSIVLSGCAQSTGTDVNDNSSSTSENQITEEANNKIAEDIEAEADDIIDSEDVEESSLTPTQRNSVNMLNYMSALTQLLLGRLHRCIFVNRIFLQRRKYIHMPEWKIYV